MGASVEIISSKAAIVDRMVTKKVSYELWYAFIQKMCRSPF